MVRLQRRRGGEEGTYRCVVPDAMNVIQTIYIGVHNTIGKSLPKTFNTLVAILRRFDGICDMSPTLLKLSTLFSQTHLGTFDYTKL